MAFVIPITQNAEQPFPDHTPHRVGQERDGDAVMDEDRHRYKLRQQPPTGRDIKEVVGKSDGQNQRPGKHDPLQLVGEGEIA